MPEFISEILIAEASATRKFIGRFNLGYKYFIEEYFGVFDVWKFQDVKNMFIDLNQPFDKENARTLRYLIVTDTALIVGEPTQENNKIFYLRGWNKLYELHKVRREKDKPNVIQFYWNEDTMREWTLQFDQADQFIQHITFRMETLGVRVEKKEYKKKMIQENEVTKAALANLNFESQETLDLIAVYEDMMNYDFCLQTINGLISLYQKAIEYYSALDSGRFEDFLNRNKALLSREDVQVLLTSSVEDKPPQLEPRMSFVGESKQKLAEDAFRIEDEDSSEDPNLDLLGIGSSSKEKEMPGSSPENSKQEEPIGPLMLDESNKPDSDKNAELISFAQSESKDNESEKPKDDVKVEDKPKDLDVDPFSIGDDEDDTEVLDNQVESSRPMEPPSEVENESSEI